MQLARATRWPWSPSAPSRRRSRSPATRVLQRPPIHRVVAEDEAQAAHLDGQPSVRPTSRSFSSRSMASRAGAADLPPPRPCPRPGLRAEPSSIMVPVVLLSSSFHALSMTTLLLASSLILPARGALAPSPRQEGRGKGSGQNGMREGKASLPVVGKQVLRGVRISSRTRRKTAKALQAARRAGSSKPMWTVARPARPGSSRRRRHRPSPQGRTASPGTRRRICERWREMSMPNSDMARTASGCT